MRERILQLNGGQAIADRMFQRVMVNGREEYRLKDSRSENVMSALVSAYGGDTTAMMNAMGSNGAGLVFDSQQRRLLAAMASRSTNGRTIAQNIADMQGSTITAQDEAFGAELYNNSERARIERDRETRRQELTRPGAAVDATRAVDSWAAEHPYLAAAAGMFGAGAVRSVAGWMMGGGSSALGAAGGAGVMGSVALGGGALLAGGGFALSLDKVAKSGGNTLAGLYDRGTADPARLAAVDAANMSTIESTSQRVNNGFGSQFLTSLRDAVRDGAREGAREGTQNTTATISPVDATHAARQAQQGGPANTSR